MQTKLTLRVDEEIIRKARRYSRQSGKSISALVSDYFRLLDARSSEKSVSVDPEVRSMLGAFSSKKADVEINEQDYRRYLEEKHS